MELSNMKLHADSMTAESCKWRESIHIVESIWSAKQNTLHKLENMKVVII